MKKTEDPVQKNLLISSFLVSVLFTDGYGSTKPK